MPRKAGLLNVREYIEWICRTADYVIEDIEKGRIAIAPGYVQEIRKIRIVGRAILKKDKTKRETTGSRKDIYVEAKSEQRT